MTSQQSLNKEMKTPVAQKFSITTLKSSPVLSNWKETSKDVEAFNPVLNGVSVDSALSTNKKSLHPAPAMIALLSFSKNYLLEFFDRQEKYKYNY